MSARRCQRGKSGPGRESPIILSQPSYLAAARGASYTPPHGLDPCRMGGALAGCLWAHRACLLHRVSAAWGGAHGSSGARRNAWLSDDDRARGDRAVALAAAPLAVWPDGAAHGMQRASTKSGGRQVDAIGTDCSRRSAEIADPFFTSRTAARAILESACGCAWPTSPGKRSEARKYLRDLWASA